MNFHKLIHCNLQQLDLLYPIKYQFKEGMFKATNIKGFQDTMQYLLNIVDAEKFSKTVPWPIIDKKTEFQFRLGVKNFLVHITEKYPEADLPKIVPSFLMNPGGEKFAQFMWKLTMFVLQKCLCEKYGNEGMLLPHKTFKNDPYAASYLSLMQILISNETQKALVYQQKIETAESQKCEWECSLELAKLNGEIKEHEEKLKDIIDKSCLSPTVKEKLQNFKNRNSVIDEWKEEVEREGRVVEAMNHVLSKHRNSLKDICSAISLSMKDTSQSYSESSLLSPDNAQDSNVKELLVNVQAGGMTFSEFLVQLNAVLGSLVLNSSAVALRNVEALASGLNSITDDFEGIKNGSEEVEMQMKEKLIAYQKSLQTILNDFPEEEVEAKGLSPPVPDVDKLNDTCELDFTPVRHVYKDIFKNRTDVESSSLEMSTKLFLTPEMERSPFTPPMSVKKEVKTTLKFSTTKSTSKEPEICDLRSLTRSIIKKRKWQQLRQQSPLDREKCPSTEPMPRVTKELFPSTEENNTTKHHSMLRSRIPKPHQISPPTPMEKVLQVSPNMHGSMFSDGLSESSNNEGLDNDLFSSQNKDDIDIGSSPSHLLSSITSNKVEESSKSKSTRRKSLDAIIQRYRKVREKMNLMPE